MVDSPRRTDGGVVVGGLAVDRPDDLILIRGHRGTGKRRLARALHAGSGRRDGVFRTFDCKACTAVEARRVFLGEWHDDGQVGWKESGRYIHFVGLLERASHGTLYLEDVDRLPLDVQRVLARVLEERSFRPIGADEEVPFRGQIIASSCRDLARLVEQGEFDERFHRLIGAQTIRIG